ncbi:MAG: hypothetical protein B7Z10_03355 [Rhodobacterales bacterium 32-66-7]|nr:MAG: hypothetical protein B7Z31_04395 [Rhodobacterales bacterium 12-65-15]OYX26433.1 MAG: hypothetical protein B7Z10_03355 [Rhodobacterales bacterium 32-66-7]
MTHRILSRLMLAALGCALALPVAAEMIGTVATNEPTMTGTPPGAAARNLVIGTGVVQDETIASSATGRGQLLFLDQTTLSLAPSTVIVLDRFVYDPATGGGEMGLQLTKGALRFIGGTLSEDQAATVTTPTATIGIRGSSALVIYFNGETIAIFLAGERLCITSGGRQVCTSRKGGVLTEDGYIGRVNPAFLAGILRILDGVPQGGSGAAPGTGVNDPNPADRGPVSTSGEEFDPDIFDDDFTFNDLFEYFPGSDTNCGDCGD